VLLAQNLSLNHQRSQGTPVLPILARNKRDFIALSYNVNLLEELSLSASRPVCERILNHVK
jgi:hypothetical protein